MVLNGQLEIGVLSLPTSATVELLVAAGRAGETPILDVTLAPGLRDMKVVAAHLAVLGRSLGPRFGVRLDAHTAPGAVPLLERLVGEIGGALSLVLLAGECADVSAWLATLRPYAKRIFREAISLGEAVDAESAGADAVVAKGNESGGRVGSETTFVLLQHLSTHLSIPVWAHGGIGPHSIAACQIGGAQGVILDGQLALAEESSLPEMLKGLIAAMDGSETICLGETLGVGYRVHRLRGAASIRELRDLEGAGLEQASFTKRLNEILERPEAEPLFPIGQDAAFARRLATRHRRVAAILRACRRQAIDDLRLVANAIPLLENGPFAQAHGTRYPILQGPMTRVSDTPAFADAVSRAGGLPFLALALFREAETERLLRATAELLGERPWGVGILGFVPPELRAEQLRAVLSVRPRFALLAGGRPDQAQSLEANGITTYIHTPSVKLLELFLKEGARRFIFEGRECGGHVGPLSSLVLWGSMLEGLLEYRREHDGDEIHIVFAGGIHDARSAAMVSALAAPAIGAGIKVGVLMGTAYLFTHEAVASGAIVGSFQEEALRCGQTALLDMEGGHAIRCAPTPYVGEFMERKRALLQSGSTREEARRHLEEMNIGRLRIASKGITRSAAQEDATGESRLVEIPIERQKQDGMYMIGQVAALRRGVCSIEELHADVARGSAERLQDVFTDRFRPEFRVRAAREPERRSPAPIAIIGIACLFPGASSLAQFWSNVLRRYDAIREVPPERWRSALFYSADPKTPDRVISKWGGFLDPIRFDPLAYGIPPNSLRSIEPVQLLMLEIVRRAFADAGYDRRPFDRERTGIVVGMGGGQPGDLALAYQTRCMVEHYLEEVPGLAPAVRNEAVMGLRQVLPELTEDSFPGVLTNVVAGRVANRFNLGGPNFTVDAACATSLAALETAVKELRYGTSDLMVVGAADTQMAPFSFLMFSKTHALSASGRCRPFDAGADGIAIGEGVAAILLKRLDDAQRDGDEIYAVLREVVGASDGRDKSLTAPSVNGQRRALNRTYASLGISPSSVGLVEAHGTGTVVGDRTELETLRAEFEGGAARPQSCALGSVKSQIGHTKNAAGLAGLIKAAMALRHRVLPPTLVEEPNAAVRDRAIPFYINTRTRPWFQSGREPRRAAISAFGFGGTNFHAVVEESPGDAVSLADRPAELFVFQGASRGELADHLEALERALASAEAIRLIDLAATLNRALAKARGACRLAIVAESVDDLRRRLGSARQALRTDAAFPDSGPVAYGEAPLDGDIAFLFPGQGSQYLNMLAELALYSPVVREVFEQVDGVLDGVLSSPLSSAIFPPPAYTPAEEAEYRRVLDQTWLAQPALGAAGFALYSLFRSVGIAPHVVGGHSYGEYVALCASESLTFSDLIRISELRGRIVQETQGRNLIGMVAVRSRPEALAPILAESPGVTIAGRNAPTQTILGGPRAAIDASLPRLDAAGISYQVLPMSAGFHIPEARPAAERFAEVLKDVRFEPPHIPIYSNRTGGVYPSASSAIREMLIDQLTQPICFQDQIEAMYAAGVRTFVEVGPGQVLSGLVRQILGDRRVMVLTSNWQGSVNALADFLKVVGRLFAAGVPLRWEGLFAGCQLRAFDLEHPLRDEQPVSPTTWLVDGANAKPLNDVARPHPSPRLRAPAAEPPQVPTTLEPHGQGAGAPGAERAAIHALSPALPTHGDGAAVSDALRVFQSGMRQFLEYQARAQEQRQQLMERFLQTQRTIMAAFFGGNGHLLTVPQPPLIPAEASSARARVPMPSAELSPQATDHPLPGGSTTASQQARKSPRPTPEKRAPVEEIVLGVVSERTGYPPAMLELDHNMEADLGIDSIKRTEIFAMLRERLGLIGDGFEKEEYFIAIGKLRTLRQVLDWVRVQVATPSAMPPEVQPDANGEGAPAPEPAEGVPLPGQTAATLHRCIVRPRLSPDESGRREPRGEEVILVTGDASGMAASLVSALRAAGHRAALIRQAAATRIAGEGMYEADLVSRESLRQLRAWIGEHFGRVTGVCHLLPLDHGPLSAELEALEVKSLFLLLSTFAQDLREASGSVVAVTGMGGVHGVDGTDGHFRVGHGAVPGFLKSLAQEWPEVSIKSVDVDPRESAEYLASQLFAEGTTNDRTVEVGYTKRGRWVLVPEEAPSNGREELAVPLDSESVILVTGGARGITAAICRAMASKYNPRFILVGRSALPGPEDPDTSGLTTASDLKRTLVERRKQGGEMVTPASIEEEYQVLFRAREIRETLAQLSARGTRFEYHALDVRDSRAFEALIASVYDRYGRIDGVIHAAGILKDGLVLDKSEESFDLVFNTKVASALTLTRTLRPDSLRFLVFFSSVAARFGNVGQADYAAANEVLNKLAWKLDREWPARVVAIGWGPWDEVGMLGKAGPELRRRHARVGLAYLPIRVGCEQFMREIAFGRKGEAEVLIFAGLEAGPRMARADGPPARLVEVPPS